MKNILHRNPIPDIEYLNIKVNELFYEHVDETTFYDNWVDKYIFQKIGA
jgi:hypothetical protein